MITGTKFSKIPLHLSRYQNKAGYFITYYGDIYFGSLWECNGYSDGFFIIPNSSVRKAITLKKEKAGAEEFREIGWEVKDHRIIKQVLEDATGFRNSTIKTNHFSEQQFTQMFVFGAAASTYCVFGEGQNKFRSANYNPPTGFEIFDEKYSAFYKKYPATKQSIPEFESRNKDVEGCLDDEWCTYKGSYNPDVTNRHINIQFYLEELFQSISKDVITKEYRFNLFNLFCKKMQKRLHQSPNQVAVLVSFNYDTILDHFVEEFTAPFKTLENYYDWHNRNMILFKPHGSSNWGWKIKDKYIKGLNRNGVVNELFTNKIEPWEIYYKLVGDISETVEYSSWGLEGKYSLNKNLIQHTLSGSNSTYLPALLMPYRDKDEFVMPYQMQFAMTSCMNHIQELFLIGWKGNEALFNRKLKDHAHSLKRLIIVNPKPSEVRDNLMKAGFDLSRYEIKEIETFERFVLSHLE